MIDTTNRNFNATASILLQKPMDSKYKKPSEDIVNWLHVELKNKHTIFYIILDPQSAEYNKKFLAKVSFAVDEIVEEITLNKEYFLYRGPEKIGTFQLLNKYYYSN